MRAQETVEHLRRRIASGKPLTQAEVALRLTMVDGLTFEKAPDLLTCFQDIFDAVCAPEHIAFHPERDKCVLVGGPGGRLEFAGTLHFDASQGPFGEISRAIYFDEGIAHHRRLNIYEPYRGFGLGAVLLEHAMGFYAGTGISPVALTAGLFAGRTYWAKLGFAFAGGPDGPDGKRTQHWFARINNALKLGADCVNYREPVEWLDVGGDGSALCSLREVAKALPRDLTEEGALTIAQNTDTDVDARLPLGRIGLLTGKPWEGALPTTRANREIVRAYLLARGDRNLAAAVELHQAIRATGTGSQTDQGDQ